MIVLLKYFVLRRNMIEAYGYTSREATRTVVRLFFTDRRIKRQLALFCEGATPRLEVGGISYADLVDEKLFAMNPYAALLFLDWMLRNPQEALKSLTMPGCGFRPGLSPDELAPELRGEVARRLGDAAKNSDPEIPEEEPVEIPKL